MKTVSSVIVSLLALFLGCWAGSHHASGRPPPPAIVHLGHPHPKNFLPQPQRAPKVSYHPVVVGATQHTYEVVEPEHGSAVAVDVKEGKLRVVAAAAPSHVHTKAQRHPHHQATQHKEVSQPPHHQATEHKEALHPPHHQPVEHKEAKKPTGAVRVVKHKYPPAQSKVEHNAPSPKRRSKLRQLKQEGTSQQEVAEKPKGGVEDHAPVKHHHSVVKHTPLKKAVKWGGGAATGHEAGAKYHHAGGVKGQKHSGHDDHEAGKKGHSGKTSSSKGYGENKGHKHHYKDEGGFGGGHHEGEHGGEGAAHKHGGHKDKGHVAKGFHDSYHKDEKKKLDAFWKNQHESGTWHEYGSQKGRHANKSSKKKAGKFAKSGSSATSYAKKKEEKSGDEKKE